MRQDGQTNLHNTHQRDGALMSRGRFLWWMAGASAVAAGAAWVLLAGRHRPQRRDGHRVSVEDRLAQYGPRADARLRTAFHAVALPYPSAEVALLAFKDTRVMELYARVSLDAEWQYVRNYPVLGASGKAGPKLMEGDRQVPEGLYQVELLNPNSRFHLSLRLNYPNDFDHRMGAVDGRSNLGSDIMIHGGASSIGCLAMGDDAAEDLFVLTARVSKERMRVLIAPTDFRLEPPREVMIEPRWAAMLYASLSEELKQFRKAA